MSAWETLSAIIRAILIMSMTGSVVGLLLFALKPLIKNHIPKVIQYYMWLLVLAAFLIPFSTFVSVPISTPLTPVQNIIEMNVKSNAEWQEQVSQEIYGVPYTELDDMEKVNISYRELKARNVGNYDFLLTYILILGAACFLKELIRYFIYVFKLRGGRLPARKNELALLPQKSPRLYRSSLATTPMLVGLFSPTIYLPDVEYSEVQLQNILRHELTHWQRHDVAVKWIATLVVHVHWFNPIAYLVRREIDHACELACDEAVVNGLDNEGKQSYGDTLIEIAADVKTHRIVVSTTMCEEKKALKERLGAIMKSKKYTKPIIIFSCVLLTILLSFTVILGATGNLNSQKDFGQTNLSEIAVDNLDLTAASGVGANLVFENDDFIIFYAEFGLFGYDLNAQNLVFSVDFMKAIGMKGSVQGSGVAPSVDVSEDGKTVIIYEYNVEADTAGNACVIDVPSLTYTRGAYQPLENAFLSENINGYIYPGVRIEQIKYILNDNEWYIFHE